MSFFFCHTLPVAKDNAGGVCHYVWPEGSEETWVWDEDKSGNNMLDTQDMALAQERWTAEQWTDNRGEMARGGEEWKDGDEEWTDGDEEWTDNRGEKADGHEEWQDGDEEWKADDHVNGERKADDYADADTMAEWRMMKRKGDDNADADTMANTVEDTIADTWVNTQEHFESYGDTSDTAADDYYVPPASVPEESWDEDSFQPLMPGEKYETYSQVFGEAPRVHMYEARSSPLEGSIGEP